MERTPLLHLPMIMPNQAQASVTHNEALMLLDGITHLAVEDRHLASPPAVSLDGARYIVAAAASGAWAGWTGSVAIRLDGGWTRLVPAEGWLAWVRDEDALFAWDGAQWVATGTAGAATLGVNATADSTNRLSVKSDAALFSHDDVTPGSGDIRIKANKTSAAHTASFLFQSGWSGRAEFGLAGSDDFSVKVSADGATWRDALTIDRATGAVAMPHTYPGLQVLSVSDSSATGIPNNSATNQSFAVVAHNDFGSGAWNGTTFTAPAAGVYDLSAVLAVSGTPSATSMNFLQNGSVQLGFSEVVGVSGQNSASSRIVVPLGAGDTITARLQHNGGAGQFGTAGASLSVVRLR